jgi:transcriptional regulator of acetoin/glycerol metabolism
VEEFGLSIKRPKFDPELIRIPNPAIPNPLLYKSTPRYWLLDGGERLIQVWRSRVFACPITAIETNVEQPFCAPGTEVKYFEETWHPRRGQNQSIKELQAQKSWTSGDLEEFYRDILRMLGRKVRRSGTYDATEELRKDLDDASSRIATYRSKRGGLETYAAELKIDRKTLARRLRRYGLSLPNPPQPSE